jgi:hypothetical protein
MEYFPQGNSELFPKHLLQQRTLTGIPARAFLRESENDFFRGSGIRFTAS